MGYLKIPLLLSRKAVVIMVALQIKMIPYSLLTIQQFHQIFFQRWKLKLQNRIARHSKHLF